MGPLVNLRVGIAAHEHAEYHEQREGAFDPQQQHEVHGRAEDAHVAVGLYEIVPGDIDLIYFLDEM